MELFISLLIVLAYLEVRDYRRGAQLRRVQLAVSKLTRRMDAERAELVKLSGSPKAIGEMGEAIGKLQMELSEVLGNSQVLVKEFQTVLQYRKQMTSFGHADFIEG